MTDRPVKAPAEFDNAFRDLVVPDLRKRCRFMGSQIALDLVGFDDACVAVMAEARRRGASRLSVERYEGLEDWVGKIILTVESEYRKEVLEYRAIVDWVAEDIDRLFGGMGNG